LWIQYKDKSFWVETKNNSCTSKEGRPTDIQYMVMRKIMSAGGTAFCARCWDDVNAFLQGKYEIINFEILYFFKQNVYEQLGYCKKGVKWDEYLRNVKSGAYLPKEILL